ncbi:unnamed protein product [Thlaspi arvense]|uniref:PGG domain-containing protein n=1 Tax=Thlaspi arvense TaxID=13288 RepID=A0AAU9RX17_THLAR|nr:unnamed protein product [Thlaspi arvense]
MIVSQVKETHGARRNKLDLYTTRNDMVSLKDKSFWRIPLFDEIRMEKRRHECTLKLAKFLIERDVSWKETFTETVHVKPKTHGIIEIVEEIIKVYPQAVEYIDYEGHGILHGAVKYRKMDIFHLLLKKMKQPMTLHTRKLDRKGNSLLHLVGIRVDTETVEKMGSPLVVLQEDLVRLESIKQITNYLINHRNNDGKTADELFAETYKDLRINATDWLKRTAENCSIVGVLIATVAFAAAYTVPGGLNQETGYPILQHKKFFVIFTFTDVLSLAFALTSVITFLSILTSPFRLKDFMSPLPQKLVLG